ncbi:MAG: efflux RND transporter periplasmic adaptor subunit [Cytophagaceae bacterium]|jgi:HlyD family secretion protein|nr:efflux RND transporter periplasmic adaptor subunit [Cytophagaceae bacterium]
MKKIFLYLILCLLVVGILWTFYFLYKNSQKPLVVFETDTAFVTTIINKTVSAGSVMPRKEVAVKSQVSGVVEKLFVEPGKYIEKGALIAKIKILPNMVNLNSAEANLTQATLRYEQAKRELDRFEKLFKEQLLSEVEYNKYVLEYQQSLENKKAAENNYQLIKEGSTKNSGKTSNLVYATVSGMVLDVPVKEGGFIIESNTFNEGTTIAFIANMNDIIFVGKVDESEVGKIKVGMPISLKIAALSNQRFPATLEFISPKGVEEDGAIKFEIKAALSIRKEELIRSGYSANADIILDKRENVLAIKESLIQFGKDSVYVEVETEPQKFVKQLIETGLSDGILIEVKNGVKAKDKLKVVVIKPVVSPMAGPKTKH